MKDTSYSDDLISFEPSAYSQSLDGCKSLAHITSRANLIMRSNYTYVNTSRGYLLRFTNVFFYYLNQYETDIKWVDIEMTYYKLLKKLHKTGKIEDVQALNSQVKMVTTLFKKYLSEVVINQEANSFNDQIDKHFYSHLKTPEKQLEYDQKGYSYDRNFVLNFNYTNTVAQYFKPTFTGVNIHGDLSNEDGLNPVLLGFGDEKDDFYHVLENANENEYLKYMKSFHYFKNDNYSKAFNFLLMEQFTVHLMGHSCGLSDRTLLQSIFEHTNCAKIKIYYHDFIETNKNGESNDYSELTMNISRHFKDKIDMRNKIANFSHSVPLIKNDR